jgi:nitrite reductase/ring-hydroxylating ferredoxin subunit
MAERSRIRAQGEEGFDRCWYPVLPAAELDAGRVVGLPFLDGRVVAYRGQSGRAQVLSPYCRHLGADLAVGAVAGDDLRCAFHHWKYGPDGRCNEIPSGDDIPQAACLFAFPTAEQLGMIWAFNGAEPTYDVPRFYRDASELAWKISEPVELPVPPWTLITNSMDFQHLRVLHGMKFDKSPDDIAYGTDTIAYDMKFEDPNGAVFEQKIKVFGSNTITLAGPMNGIEVFAMFSGRPVPGGTCGWGIHATLRPQDTDEARQLSQTVIAMVEAFFMGLIKEDEPVMSTIRFREDQLVGSDAALGRFLKYVRSYPRAHPARDLIT